MLYVIGTFSVAAGLIAELGRVRTMLALGIGSGSVAGGALYVALAYYAKAKRSSAALAFALIIAIVDGAVAFSLATNFGVNPAGSMIARLLLLVPIWRGIVALNQLNATPRALSWTDRRVIAREQQRAPEAPPLPRVWSPRAKRTAQIVIVASVATATLVTAGFWFGRRGTAAARRAEKNASASERDLCLYNYAILRDDSSACRRIEARDRVRACIEELAALERQREACSQLEAGSSRDACVVDFIDEGADPVLCELVEKDAQRSCSFRSVGKHAHH